MKRLKISLITTSIILILLILSNIAYATDTMNLNIVDERPYTNSSFTATVGGQGTQKDARVFKVLKDGVYTVDDYFALYCLRSGLGFGSIDLTGTTDPVTYTKYGDLKQESDRIIDYYQNVIGYTNIDTDNSYNAILWIVDNMYLPENPDMDRAAFLKKAGLENSTLTDDEIEVIQQMALWYFANYDLNGQDYSLSLADSVYISSILKKNGNSYSTVSEVDQIDALYRYFIDNAKANAAQYGNAVVRDLNAGLQRVEIDKTNPLTITTNAQGDYVIGPINIKKTDVTDDFDVTVKIKDGQNVEIPEKTEEDLPVLFNEQGLQITLDDLIGNGDVYVYIPSLYASVYDLSEITVETTTTYFKTTASLWTADEADQQPILKVEKEKITETDKITTKRITGNLKLQIRKVDPDGNLLIGAGFTVIDETEGRETIILRDNGDGTFETVEITITDEGQTFTFNIEETTVPSGYVGINGPFRIKVTTKLSDDGTTYVIEKVEIVDSTGAIVDVPGVQPSFTVDGNIVTITVENSKTKEFDLALRKYITKINGISLTGDDDRTPKVDTTDLNGVDATTGEKITTAKYIHPKTPVVVKQGDIVTYKIRIYNEGELDGYATQIADYIPEGLGYLMDYKENTNNFWHPVVDGTNQTVNLVGTDGLYATEDLVTNLAVTDFNNVTTLSDVRILAGKAQIYSTALENSIIKAYDPEKTAADIEATDTWQQSINGTDGLYYREIEVTCIVLAENTYEGILRNIAEIKEDKVLDEDGNILNIDDRDSRPDNVDIDNYNPPSDNSSYQQDDDDYEPLVLRHFDLALRKFITGVNDEAVTTRIPQPTLDENGEIKYEHDKTPVEVANSDLVTYTIRVYNEGTVLGYATEIADDIPDGVIFLPTNETNVQYGWKMYDASGNETADPTQAVEIRTDYLKDELLQPFDSTKAISTTEPYNPDYAEVKVVFQVVEQNITSADRIITNKAHITADKAVDEDGNEIDIDDDDSIPNEWNEGEDDQDVEHIYVKYFDLALLKWVTKTIVTVDGETVTTETGFTPEDDPEPVAKVVIDKKKIDSTVVKFVYRIRITNQGEIAGYATEITDYIPAGLTFVQEDNPLWTKTGDNTIATRALEGTLLQPGESAEVEVIFTWINGSDNLGLKTNIAEISEDYNDKDAPDIDSVPDNVKPDGYDEQQEDDDDKALVILEIQTGGNTSYMWLVLVVLTILAGGIVLIKKVVV